MAAQDPSDTTHKSEEAEYHLVRVDPSSAHFHTVRFVLVVEGVVLAVLGIWGLIAAWHYHDVDPTGATVLVFRFTVAHAAVLVGTAFLAFVATIGRRIGLMFAALQAVAYLLMFIVSAGSHNTYSNAGDAVLHGVLCALGLAMVMWAAGRSLDGYYWVRQPHQHA